jgi:hypothetical protein
MSKIDIDQLRKEIRGMNRWNVLYKALKEELSALNYWCDKPRGNPSKAGKASWSKRKEKEVL